MSTPPENGAVNQGQASSSKDDISLEEKIGIAKKFDREMKDYAKATVKEFLGIYGYEEDVDINMDESETQKSTENTTYAIHKQAETEATSSTVSTMTNAREVEKEAGAEHPVSSVSISSSTTNGSAESTRFCITMSIPRPGADSLEGYTTLRFWNCIMCSTPFVGTKPEIIQRVHHPQLFTHQPEWLSHAGICERCQLSLTMQTPKITIYAISETPQYHHVFGNGVVPGVPRPSTSSIPTPGDSNLGPCVSRVPGTYVPGAYISGPRVVFCNGLVGQCNCAHGGQSHVHGHLAYQGVNGSVVTRTGLNQTSTDAGYVGNTNQYIPITCTQ